MPTQVWYLQGWALHLSGDAACVESLEQAKRTYHANNCERPEVLEHIEELLAEHSSAMDQRQDEDGGEGEDGEEEDGEEEEGEE